MAKKMTAQELEQYLQKLKEKEQRLKEELILQRKNEEAKAKRERNRRVFALVEKLVERYGEEILDEPEETAARFVLREKEEPERAIFF